MLPYFLAIIQAVAAVVALLLSKEQSPVPGSADGRKPRNKWLRRILLGLIFVILLVQSIAIRRDSVERESDKNALAESNNSLSNRLVHVSSELSVQTRLHVSNSNSLAQLHGMLSPITNRLGMPAEQALAEVEKRLASLEDSDQFVRPSDSLISTMEANFAGLKRLQPVGSRIEVCIPSEGVARQWVAQFLTIMMKRGGLTVGEFQSGIYSIANPGPVTIMVAPQHVEFAQVLGRMLNPYFNKTEVKVGQKAAESGVISIHLVGQPRFYPTGQVQLR